MFGVCVLVFDAGFAGVFRGVWGVFFCGLAGLGAVGCMGRDGNWRVGLLWLGSWWTERFNWIGSDERGVLIGHIRGNGGLWAVFGFLVWFLPVGGVAVRGFFGRLGFLVFGGGMDWSAGWGVVVFLVLVGCVGGWFGLKFG